MAYKRSSTTKKASGSGGQPPKKPSGSGKRPSSKPSASGDAKRRYVCSWALADGSPCSKGYNKKEHLDRHIRTKHTEERPYACPAEPACDGTFARKDIMQNHARTCMHVRAAGIQVAPRRRRNGGNQESASDSPPSPGLVAGGPSAGPSHSWSPPSPVAYPLRRFSSPPQYRMRSASPSSPVHMPPSAPAVHHYSQVELEFAGFLSELARPGVADLASQSTSSSDASATPPGQGVDSARIRRASDGSESWMVGEEEGK